MTVRPIRLMGDPVLRQPARPVMAFDIGTAALVADLLDTVREPGRAGVAAPQIGISLRAFSYLVHGEEGLGCVSRALAWLPPLRGWLSRVSGRRRWLRRLQAW